MDGPYCPVPVTATVCGLLLALSDTVRVAVRAPVALGVNVTEMVHLPLACTLPSHVLVSAKSPGSAPANEMPLIVSVVGRLFVSVTFLAALVVPTVCAANVSEVGDTVACATPLPVSATVCGLPAALSVKVRLALREPS